MNKKVFVITYYINSKNEYLYLALKLSPEENRSSGYYVITGDVEVEENIETAAYREVIEETGIKPIRITDLNMILEYTDHIDNKTYEEYVFAAQVDSKKVTLSGEHTEFKWLNIKDFIATIWWDDEKSLLEDILKNINSNKRNSTNSHK